MLWNILCWFARLIYIPKPFRTCEYGYHDWGNWHVDALIFQRRDCKRCGRIQVTGQV